MNITVLQTFLTVVRTGNLNSAASELNVTQSAVTARLDALEQLLGQQLLVRSRKGAILTKSGYAFLEYANVIVRAWQNAQAKINLPRGAIGLFSFVCDPSLWRSIGETWIDNAKVSNPGIAFEIWHAEIEFARNWLQGGLSDAALLLEPIVGADFESRVFSTETLVQASTVKRKAVHWHEKYVMVDYGHFIRSQHAEAWPNDMTAHMSFSNPDWALEYILKHGGSAYLPLSKIQPLLDNGTLHLLEDVPTFEQRTFLSWRAHVKNEFPWIA